MAAATLLDEPTAQSLHLPPIEMPDISSFQIRDGEVVMNRLLEKTMAGWTAGIVMVAGSVAVAQQQQRETSPREQPQAAAGQRAETGATAYLGVAVDSVPPVVAAQLGERLQADQGVLVADVADDSPAAKSGLRANDILLSYDGQNLASPSQLVSLVRQDEAGSTVKVEVLRDGEPQEMEVTLGERPAATAPATGRRMPRWFSQRAPDATGQSGERPSVWTSFESLSLESLDGDRYRVEIRYSGDDGATQRHTYEGTREEIRREIEDHEALPEEKRQRLLEALDLTRGARRPSFEGFELPGDRDLFRDLREFEEALRQRLQRDF